MLKRVWVRTLSWVVLLAIPSLGCSNGSNAGSDPGDADESSTGGTGPSIVRGTSVSSASTATTSGSTATLTSSTGTGGGTGTGGSTGTGGAPPIGHTAQGGGPDNLPGAGGEGGEPPEEEEPPLVCPGFDEDSLEVSTVDADCDAETPDSCEDGTHIDFSAEDDCAVCAPDTAENRSCTWAMACFEPFLQTIAHRSGAKRCQNDSDCAGFTISGCGGEVTISLYALIDEEIPWIAEMYAEQNCSALCPGEPGFVYDRAEGTPACIDGECSFAQ